MRFLLQSVTAVATIMFGSSIVQMVVLCWLNVRPGLADET